MLDILLDSDDRDIMLSDDGDIVIDEDDIKQAITTRIMWFAEEWRLGPDYGFPWYEEMLVKNPDIYALRRNIIEQITDVDGVTDCSVSVLKFDKKSRKITFEYNVVADGEKISGEVELSG